MKKVLLVTFSDNADHQDICFGMFESLRNFSNTECDIWVMGTKTPKVPVVKTSHTILVDCPKRPGIERKTFDIKVLFSIIRWVNKQKFNVIFFESLHVWNLAIMLFCHGHRKVFQMIHDLIPHKGDKQEKSVQLMNRVVCKLADYIVLCNKKFATEASHLYGIQDAKIRCVDMWRRFPSYTEPKFTKRVLFFGRINPYKGLDNLLEIVRMCPDIDFDIIGKVDPQMEETFKELAEFPNVTANDGYVSDSEMKDAFINADWVILPYSSATQSGVVVDSYRFSRPCIAFNVGAISEQIEEGISGFLVKEGDICAFAKMIKCALEMDESAYRKMSLAAYNYGVKKYASDGAVNRFMNLIS